MVAGGEREREGEGRTAREVTEFELEKVDLIWVTRLGSDCVGVRAFDGRCEAAGGVVEVES